ncbi:MAG: hypothetical protein K6D97_08655 [Clostridia bacterium]|nr:hypothetical protein [Clostridia bacterium]
MPKIKDKTIALYIGTFDGKDNTFTWKKEKEFKTYEEAEKEFNKVCISTFDLTYEDFKEKYGSPRLDVEIRQGSKMLKWFGIYEKQDALEISEDPDAE